MVHSLYSGRDILIKSKCRHYPINRFGWKLRIQKIQILNDLDCYGNSIKSPFLK